VVQKTSRKNVTSAVLIFLLFCLFNARQEWKNHNHRKRNALKYKKKRNIHTVKELEAH